MSVMIVEVQTTEFSRGWRYPRPVQRFATKLLTQQFWCLGQDVLSPHGNLLMEYGFSRHRGSAGKRAKSTYYTLEEGELRIALWAFGAVFAERSHGGIFLDRFNFKPGWSSVDSLPYGVHSPEQLPRFPPPASNTEWQSAHRLCQSMLEWFASYETWVAKRYGLEYRQKCVEKWSRPVANADQIADAWTFLSRRSWEHSSNDWAVTLTTLKR